MVIAAHIPIVFILFSVAGANEKNGMTFGQENSPFYDPDHYEYYKQILIVLMMILIQHFVCKHCILIFIDDHK